MRKTTRPNTTTRLAIRIDEKLRKGLRATAKSADLTESQFVRKLIREAVAS